MASRLSELLERIRPAGTPGSADDRATRQAAGAAEELAALRAALDAAEAEADEVVTAAEHTAAAARAEAEERARSIRDQTPDRAARVAARAVAALEAPDPALADLAREASHAVAALEARSDALADRRAREVVEDLWSLLDAADPGGGRR